MEIGHAASKAARLALEVKPEINATSGADTAQLAVHAKYRRCEVRFVFDNSIRHLGDVPALCTKHAVSGGRVGRRRPELELQAYISLTTLVSITLSVLCEK